jgi:hypothetical protein
MNFCFLPTKENHGKGTKNEEAVLFLSLVKKAFLCTLFIVFIAGLTFGQTPTNPTPKSKPKFIFGGVNMVAYKGSLQESYKRWTPAIQTGLSVAAKENMNLVFGLSFGQFIGEDRTYRLPANSDLSLTPSNRFKTNFISFTAEAQFKAFEYKNFKLLASIGLGLFRFSPLDFEGNDLVSKPRSRERTEDYSQNTLQLPIQMVAQYWFKEGLGVAIQGGWHNVGSRYLDNMDKLANNDRPDNLAVFKFLILGKI